MGSTRCLSMRWVRSTTMELFTLQSGKKSFSRLLATAIKAPASAAIEATSKKKACGDMLAQNPPSHPASKLPVKLVVSQTPITAERDRSGAMRDTSDSAMGEKKSSARVITAKYAASQSQLSSPPRREPRPPPP